MQDVQDAMTKGDLSNFMNAMGISTDDVWTGLGVDSESKTMSLCWIEIL